MLIQTQEKGVINDLFIEAIYESSNILMTTYFPNTNKLFIHFNRGGTYSYTNINESLYKEFENAESQGKFFIANIKKNPNKYPYAKEYKLTATEINEAKQVINEYHERN
jgi:hypothetical protein